MICDILLTEFITSAGWSPKYTVEDNLEKLVKWYLENPEWLEF